MPVVSAYLNRGSKTAAADACNCDGIGLQYYGTLLKAITYETNNQLLSLVLVHYVGSECEEYWKSGFVACKCLPDFNIAEQTTIVDREKSIDKAYQKVVRIAKLFLDALHVKKNMGPKLGNDKAVGLFMYDCAVHAPSKGEADKLISEYRVYRRTYLAQFSKSVLYRVY